MAYDTEGPCEVEVPSKSVRGLTLLEATKLQLMQAREEVKRLEELGCLLEANPETQKILDLLKRRGH